MPVNWHLTTVEYTQVLPEMWGRLFLLVLGREFYSSSEGMATVAYGDTVFVVVVCFLILSVLKSAFISFGFWLIFKDFFHL